MGVFQSRPEEPDEWAGLPAEPWQPREPSELLPPAVSASDLFGVTGVSVSLSVEPPLEPPTGPPTESTNESAPEPEPEAGRDPGAA